MRQLGAWQLLRCRDLALCLLGGLIGLSLALVILATELDRQWILVPRGVIQHGP